ncbi:MAG: GTP cyclohydrolase FolE2 [Candidatus Wallbacteria bacterium]
MALKKGAAVKKNADKNKIAKKLPDVQSEFDTREIAIDKVGVSGISYPVTVLDRTQKRQKTVAQINMFVDLPKHFRGTHMSRFLEVLNSHRGLITMLNADKILKKMIAKFEAKSAHFTMKFPYFIEKSAPVSKIKSLLNYECEFISSYSDKLDFVMGVKVPVTTLCPCSKEVSAYGAHNQRSFINIHIRFKEFMWIEDLVKIAESAASSQIYSLLKRGDEKYVTEYAYKNPRFVEDVVREVAVGLMNDDNITWFTIEVINQESIHNHDAYAIIRRDKTKL